jgi:hypothetical protein
MCVKLCKDDAFKEDSFWCFGGIAMGAMQKLAEFRNEQPPKYEMISAGNGEAAMGKEFPQGCCDLFTRRALAEAGFALLAVVGVVESVVRVILGLITLVPFALISLCGADCVKNPEGQGVCFASPIALLIEGVTGIIDFPLRGIVALVKNVCEKEFHFNDLALCELVNCETL